MTGSETENSDHTIEHDGPNSPAQGEMPFAVVGGEALTELPQDLYIPPDALEVFLEAFEGPLDLLLYLIRKQNMDILDIPVAEVTKQYMQYVEVMQELQLELAAEYLVMAAMLAEIKSRMLLPRPAIEEQEGEDPRAELVRRLQEYERYRKAGEDINHMPRMGRDLHVVQVKYEGEFAERPQPNVSMNDLLKAFKDVMTRHDMYSHHHVSRETLSVRERMTQILERVKGEQFVDFQDLFNVTEGRMGVVVSFVAILELLKEELLTVIQPEPFAPIHVKAAA
jgi:segregation and condensation protein A